MSEHIFIQNEVGQANGSTLTLLANALHKLPNSSRSFHLNSDDAQQVFSNHLLRESLPSLIIKIIGTNNQKRQYSVRASIQNALKSVLRTLMEQTHVWLFNGVRAMIDLEEDDLKLPSTSPSSLVTCEPFGKSQLFIYQSEVYRFIDQILSQIRQTSTHVPLITLLIEGDSSSVTDLLENLAKHIPTIILKGTGLIANQLAEFYQPVKYGAKTPRRESSTEQILTEEDLRRLNYRSNNNNSLISVGQPGKDELDDRILQAITVAMRIIDRSHARITEFKFAVEWNKIEYTQRHILNHNTMIYWTDNDLDQCLEMAIRLNAVSFVELLFEYGASLQRLAVIGDPNLFKLKTARRTRSHTVESMIENIPVISELNCGRRVNAYLRLLFDWTVENQYFELAMSICARLEDSIVAMLLVSQWCEFKERMDYTTSTNYRIYRRQFEKYAADVLDLYFADDEKKTIELLQEKSILYYDQQAAVVIDDLCSKTLVSTKCMQAYMTEIWYGRQFHMEKNAVWEILICLTCFCPLLLFVPTIRDRIFQWDKNGKIGRAKNLCSRISYQFEPFRRFYQGNAVIRFHYNMLSYIAFLVLFSYVILFDYFPLNIYGERRSNIYRLPIPITEFILHVFLASIALEEFRQIILHVRSAYIKSPYWGILFKTNRHRNTIWSFYRNDYWNVLDFVAFTLWTIGFATRFVVRDRFFEVSKICMSLDLCLWYMRCLHVFLASEKLGPKLLMIFHTMKDLMSFLYFILIFLFAYTITTFSLISTSSFVEWSNASYFTTIQNGGNLTGVEILRSAIEWGTWRIFGSTTLTTTDSVHIKYSAQNDAYGFVTLLLTITFLVIAYVLLLNNLIALFNFTIQRVHGESHRAWCYHFYVVLKEYEKKDLFVPPFNLLLYPIIYFLQKRCSSANSEEAYVENDAREKKRIKKYQQRIAEKYWKEQRLGDKKPMGQRFFTCDQCQCQQAEVNDGESTFL